MKKKFIMLVNCYPHQYQMADKEDHFLLPCMVMKEKGYECEYVTLRDQGKKTIETVHADDQAAVSEFRGFKIKRFDSTFKLLRYIRKQDAILQSNLRPWLPTTLSAFLPNTKVMRSYTYYMGSKKHIAFISALIFRRFDKILAVTPYEVEVYKKYKIPEKKIVHIPLAIDYEYFSQKVPTEDLREKYGIKETDKIIIASANIRKLKKFDILLKALPLVKKEVPEAKVLIMGNDMLHDQGLPSLKEIAAELGITDSVILPGFLDQETIRKCYSVSDVFVHPAADEYQGMVSYEAASSGVPLCLSIIGSHTSVYKEHALYHEVEDYEKLAENIITCLKKPEQRAEHVAFLKEHMKQWDYPVIKEKLSAFYDGFAED